MDYNSGTITVDSTGTMSDSTSYYIDYLYYNTGNPIQFCMEYDATNGKYIFRLDPVPDSELIASLLWENVPSDLSASVDTIWTRLEFAIERGGIYYGSMEIIDDAQLRSEFKQNYEVSMQALIQLDRELEPKHDRIPLVMRRTDYTARSIRPIGTTGVR